jgi:hypothetical protein
MDTDEPTAVSFGDGSLAGDGLEQNNPSAAKLTDVELRPPSRGDDARDPIASYRCVAVWKRLQPSRIAVLARRQIIGAPARLERPRQRPPEVILDPQHSCVISIFRQLYS